MNRTLIGLFLMILIALAASATALAQKRMVIIDQDTSGPGGSNIMSMMALLQSPQVEVLGITVVTGNAWRDDEARHALRLLELIGRTDVPVDIEDFVLGLPFGVPQYLISVVPAVLDATALMLGS